MEHKVVAAASMIITFRIQCSPSKCKTNCLSLRKKLHHTPIKAFQLCSWLYNSWRYIFKGMLQTVGGYNVPPQNELDKEEWGVKSVRRNETFKSRALILPILHKMKAFLWKFLTWHCPIALGGMQVYTLSLFMWAFRPMPCFYNFLRNSEIFNPKMLGRDPWVLGILGLLLFHCLLVIFIQCSINES